MKPPKKKSGKNPLLWILLLILIGGGAYVAMEPEMVMDLVGPYLGETPEPPSVAKKPIPPKPPVQSPPPVQPAPSAAAQAVPAVEPPQTNMTNPPPAPAATAEPSMPVASVPASVSHSPSMAAPPAAEVSPPVGASANPLFGEGQRVTLLPHPGSPRDKVALSQDAAGTKPGPAVPPGTAFTILDGDLQDRGWMYYVRSDYGTKGWLEEKQLRAKR